MMYGMKQLRARMEMLNVRCKEYERYAPIGPGVIAEADRAAMQFAVDEIKRLKAIESAVKSLIKVAADNIRTLADRGHKSQAFQAAGDQWHAAYSELKAALAAKGKP